MANRTPPPPVQPREVVKFDPKAAYADIEKAIRDKEDAIVATLVPTIPRERFLSVALQAVTRSPRLLECTPASIVKALRDAAELGLEPSGLLGSAYLVPYRNKASGRYEAQLIPGYRGLIDLARRSGEVKTIEAHVVRERDTFEYAYGSDQFLRHRPWMNLTNEYVEQEVEDPNTGDVTTQRKALDAGPYVAFYAFARLSSGEFQFDVMSVPEVDAIRRRSKAADDGPWVTDYVEMGRKTPTRRLLKWLPLSPSAPVIRALELEDIAEGGAESPVTVTNPARARLQAALIGHTNGNGDDAKADTDDAASGNTTDDDSDGEARSDATSDDADAAPAPTTATCGALSPYDGDGTCTLDAGHPGAHRTEDAAWPQ